MTADPKPASPRFERIAAAAALAAVFALAVALSAYLVNSFDLPWHYKTGEWIVAHRRVPDVDFWNFTRRGLPWIDAQWLFQVVAYTSGRLFGEAGPSILTVSLTAGLLGLLVFSVPSMPLPLRAVTGLLLILAMDERIMCRPELLSCLFMAAMFFALERARAGRTRWLALTFPIMLLWANSQGLWPIGVAVMAAYLIDHAAEAYRRGEFSLRRPVPVVWAAAMIAAVAAGLCQPYGLKGFVFPLELLHEVGVNVTLRKAAIVEFQGMFSPPPLLRAEKFFFILAVLAVAVQIAAVKKLRPGMVLLGVAFLWLTVNARRNVSVGSVALAQLTLINLAALRERLPLKALAIAAIIIALPLTVITFASPQRDWDKTGREPGLGLSPTYYPDQAAAFLKSISYQGNIITNVRLGGYLFHAGWPDWLVMADPRMEIEGERSLALWQQVFHDHRAFVALANEHQADAVVVDLMDKYLEDFALRVYDDPDWALVDIDRPHRTLVFLRRGPRWDQVIERKEIGW